MATNAPASPFAPAEPAQLGPIPGIAISCTEAGIKYKGRKDLALFTFTPGTVVAGVLTQSKTRSAPVEWCADILKTETPKARALVVNSGNANAFTGKRGHEAVELTAAAAAQAANCAPSEVLLASTGVIGEPLDASSFANVLQSMAGHVTPDAWTDAAATITTTDTFPKLATELVQLPGGDIRINAIAKGAGMIAPDMATMLCFIFTDARISQRALQNAVAEFADVTFNCVTVDGDTSTSDTVLAFATGQSKMASILDEAEDPDLAAFRVGLHKVMRDLAIQIAQDGEGLTKFVTINVTGAENDEAARKIALAVGNSPLVKTAVAGEDPNWGRIVMAVGKAGEKADRDRLSIDIGPHAVARAGERMPEYDETPVAAYMKQPEITLHIDVGIDAGEATVWTCDLTHGYISINADYRS